MEVRTGFEHPTSIWESPGETADGQRQAKHSQQAPGACSSESQRDCESPDLADHRVFYVTGMFTKGKSEPSLAVKAPGAKGGEFCGRRFESQVRMIFFCYRPQSLIEVWIAASSDPLLYIPLFLFSRAI